MPLDYMAATIVATMRFIKFVSNLGQRYADEPTEYARGKDCAHLVVLSLIAGFHTSIIHA